MKQEFIFHRVRKSTRADNEIVIQGYCSEEFIENYDVIVEYKQGNQALNLKQEIMVGGMPAFARLEVNDIDINHMVSVAVKLPLKRMNDGYLEVVAKSKSDSTSIDMWRGTIKDIVKALKRINLQVNSVIDDGEELTIKGWLIDNKKLNLIALRDGRYGEEINDAAIERIERQDVINQFPEYKGDENVGFVIYCPKESKKIYLQVRDDKERILAVRRILWLEGDANLNLGTKIKKNYVKFHDYRHNVGNAATFRKIKKRISYLTRSTKVDYDAWIKNNVGDRLKKLKEEACQKQTLPEGYILVTEPGVRLTRDAMYSFTKALETGKYQIVYSDHDEYTNTNGNICYENPSFKPDFNLDLLRGYNYIGDTFAISKKFLEENNLQDKLNNPVEKHSVLLKAYEKGGNIGHIPQVLYHRNKDRVVEATYDREAGVAMLQEHYDRLGIDAKVELIPDIENVEKALNTGYYKTTYKVAGNPKVSIVIPNKDHIEDLDKCIASIDKSDYKNYEIIVVENNSTEAKTIEYYKTLEERENTKVVRWEKEFNFSAINNFGVKYASGDYVLLLNNDTEIINSSCISQLLGCCQRQDVGAVGGRLYYEDGTIQHAGVIIGLGGIAGHIFTGQEEKTQVYQGRSYVACDYNAVTAACLMVRREDYLKVGGLDENFKVAFNDIDFCLKIRELGKLVVYNPEATLYHYESKSRGSEDTPGRMDRFLGEIERFMGKWPELINGGDPYYNRNLALDRTDWAMKV